MFLIFCLQLKLTFEREEIEVKYLDEDNEEVCINSNEELVEAFKVTEHKLLQTCHTHAITPELHALQKTLAFLFLLCYEVF